MPRKKKAGRRPRARDLLRAKESKSARQAIADADPTWQGKKPCCRQKCFQKFDDEEGTGKVAKWVRQYMACLTKVDEKVFISDRRVKRDADLNSSGGELLHSRVCHFVIEPPNQMLAKLESLIPSGKEKSLIELKLAVDGGTARLTRPNLQACDRVCEKYFLHLCLGRTSNFVRPYLSVRPEARTQRSKVLVPDSERAIRGSFAPNASPKKDPVTTWLKDQTTQHMMLPTVQKTVCPYTSKKHAHAEFVLETEQYLDCIWWGRSLEEYHDNLLNGAKEQSDKNKAEAAVDLERVGREDAKLSASASDRTGRQRMHMDLSNVMEEEEVAEDDEVEAHTEAGVEEMHAGEGGGGAEVEEKHAGEGGDGWGVNAAHVEKALERGLSGSSRMWSKVKKNGGWDSNDHKKGVPAGDEPVDESPPPPHSPAPAFPAGDESVDESPPPPDSPAPDATRSAGVASSDSEVEHCESGVDGEDGSDVEPEVYESVHVPPARSIWRYGNELLGLKQDGPPVDDRIASYRYFVEIWTEDWNDKLVLRKWLPFSKCDDCIGLRNQLRDTRDKEVKEPLQKKLREHLAFVKRERAAYTAKRMLGTYQPEEYLSVIIDGADQSDHQLPHSAHRSHATDAAWKLKLHLLGVLVHGRGQYVYTCPGHIAQGNNVTIQALWDTIVQVHLNEGKLPNHLLLQLDNTTKSCKGRYVLAFLALLVEYGIFKRVTLSFLPVGHTHEDIDQFFSCIAKILRQSDAHSRIALARCVKKSFSKWGVEPVVTHWSSVANISGWLDTGSKLPTKYEDITAFHQFRFLHSETTGKVWMQSRRWPGSGDDDHWTGFKGNDVHQQIWKNDVVPDLLADFDSVPDTKRCTGGAPSAEAQKTLRSGLDACYKFLKISDIHRADCEALFELYSTPATDRMPFAWKKKVLFLVYS